MMYFFQQAFIPSLVKQHLFIYLFIYIKNRKHEHFEACEKLLVVSG